MLASQILAPRVGAMAVATALLFASTTASFTWPWSKPLIPDFALKGVHEGKSMPMLALNTVGLTMHQADTAVRMAMSAGITNVDFHRGPHRYVLARILASQGRESLYLTTKVDAAFMRFNKTHVPSDADTAKAQTARVLAADRRALGVDSVDLLLLRDSPSCETIQGQWAALEAALAAGQAAAIGTINFCEGALRCLLEKAEVKPAVN